MPRPFAPLAVVLAAVGLAACGSSSNHHAKTTTPAPTSASSTPAETGVSSTPTNPSTTGTSTSAGPPLSAAAFTAAFAARRRSFQTIGVDLARLLVAAPKLSNARLASDFSLLAEALAGNQSALASLVPPAQYTGQYDGLIADFSPVAVDLSALAADSRGGDATKATADTKMLVKDATRLRNADVALAKTLGLGN